MPIYDYECKSCHDKIEILHGTNDTSIRACEKCEGQLEKVITNMTFHLYGPGFYTTDNKKKYLK